jgi:16S rRNA (cytidine1402-2'-O)-methyltransferase
MAHSMGITVKPLSGPSSVILALISSGMNGQSFTFNGYLPIKPHERVSRIKELEARSLRGETQIFMETPYRNTKLLTDILGSCRDTTKLCIAAGISTGEEMILTRTIAEWRRNIPAIDRIPAIFVLQA